MPGRQYASGREIFMVWSERLYLEPELEQNFKRIRWKLMHKKPQKEIYLLAISGGRLEMISSLVLLQKTYPDDFTVVGLASSRSGALELIRRITADIYEEQGNFDYPVFFYKSLRPAGENVDGRACTSRHIFTHWAGKQE